MVKKKCGATAAALALLSLSRRFKAINESGACATLTNDPNGRWRAPAGYQEAPCISPWRTSTEQAASVQQLMNPVKTRRRNQRLAIAIGTALLLGGARFPAHAQTRLLGIPFGQKVSIAPCPADPDEAQEPCWLEQPELDRKTGVRTGKVHLSGYVRKPVWALWSTVHVEQDRKGRVQRIVAATDRPREGSEILRSVSRSFGPPLEESRHIGIVQRAVWRSPTAYAEMRCSEGCAIEFLTPAAQAAREAREAQRGMRQ
jgi:hypothetical protein